MWSIRKKRIIWILFLISSVGLSVSLILYALRQNISLYYTPTQMEHISFSSNTLLRLGGFVAQGSVQHQPYSLKVKFALTDHRKTIWVYYDGILPSLFHVGQGVVAEGRLEHGIFYANQVLAKHDATYHPPGLA